MKCKIIQDLLPLYCDKLTSEESNEEIEKHLHDCEKCSEIYENMCAKEEVTIDKSEKDIKPLKKVKQKFVFKLIAGFFAIAVALSGIFTFLFYGVIPISSDKLDIKVSTESFTGFTFNTDENGNEVDYEEYENEYLSVTFIGDCKAIRKETLYPDPLADTSTRLEVTIYPVLNIPFNSVSNQFTLFIRTGDKDETITIHCRDKDMTYTIAELYKMLEE